MKKKTTWSHGTRPVTKPSFSLATRTLISSYLPVLYLRFDQPRLRLVEGSETSNAPAMPDPEFRVWGEAHGKTLGPGLTEKASQEFIFHKPIADSWVRLKLESIHWSFIP